MGVRWSDLRIRTKLITSYLVVILVLIVLGVVQYFGFQSMRGKTRNIVESAPLVYAAKEMRFSVARNLQVIQELLTEEDPKVLDELLTKARLNSESFLVFSNAILKGAQTREGYVYPAQNSEIKKIVVEARKYREDSFAPIIEKISVLKTGASAGKTAARKKEELDSLNYGAHVAGEAMLDILGRVDGLVRAEIARAEQASEKNATFVTLYSGLWIFVGLVLSILMGMVITRDITKPIYKCVYFASTISRGEVGSTLDMDRSDETGTLATALNTMGSNLKRTVQEIMRSTEIIASSSEELAATTLELAEGAKNQASQTEQSATSMTEMSQTILEVARNAADVAEVAKQSMVAAKAGRDDVSHTVEGMRRIAETVNRTAASIGELGRSSQQIGEITSTINDIADQTNLLALNAAIEAARAGEAGRGFAVVADEVRKLAERTARATKEIEEMISKIQEDTQVSVRSMESGRAEVEGGVKLAEGAMTSLEQIVKSSDKSAEMVQRIATSTEQQSSAAEEVSNTIEEIASVTRKNESSSVQIQNAIQELARVSSEMKETMRWFRL